ncbi:MAG: bifunctional methionine sulfoxide reductase B/A protein [Bacteroidia bacterium]
MKKSIVILSTFFLLFLSLESCAQKQKANNQAAVLDGSKIEKTEEQWKKELSEEQYYVLRQKGTEAPYTGKLLMNKEKGVYKCAACGNELFTDDMKFDSHCGWPSFDKEIKGGKIKTQTDNSHGMQRTEIMCAKCGGHLGHLFDDGPTETGMRYCVNSVSLDFVSEKELQQAKSKKPQLDTLTLGGGCFWCVEAVYEMLEGVKSVESGYSGGTDRNSTYEEVSSGNSGHAEVAQIIFDPSVCSVEDILEVFFTVHDPTTLNRQGNDIGPQYRSVIFYKDKEQKNKALAIINDLNAAKAYPSKIVTAVEPFQFFVRAEEYHQDYYAQNKQKGYCRLVIQPKIEKFEKVFADKKKKQ